MSKTARRLFKESQRSSTSAPPRALSSDVDSDGYNSDTSVISIEDVDLMPRTAGTSENLQAELRTALDSCTESRASSRELGLAKLSKLMGHTYLDEMNDVVDTTMDVLLKCLKRDKSIAENMAALKAISLFFITLGPGHEARYAELAEVIVPLISKPGLGKPELICATMIEVLSLCCFVTGTSENTTILIETLADQIEFRYKKLMHAFESSTGSNAVQAAQSAASATSGQAKVSTSQSHQPIDKLPGSKLIPAMVTSLGALATVASVHQPALKVTPTLIKIVDPTSPLSVECKVLGAETIAIFVEMDALDDSTVVDQLVDHLQSSIGPSPGDVSVKRGAQRDRKSQRSAYRDVLSYLVDDSAPPTLTLKFQNERVEFSSWTQLRQLFLFKNTLGPLIHVHFVRNPLFRDIFQYTLSSNAGLTKSERKAIFNPSSPLARTNTKHRAKLRSIRVNKINQFD